MPLDQQHEMIWVKNGENHRLFNLDGSIDKNITFHGSSGTPSLTEKDKFMCPEGPNIRLVEGTMANGHGKFENRRNAATTCERQNFSNSAKQDSETTIPNLLWSPYKTSMQHDPATPFPGPFPLCLVARHLLSSPWPRYQ